MQLGELHKRRLDSENPAKKASRLFEMPVGLGPGTTCFVGNNWTKPTAKNSHDPSSHLPARERFGDHVRALRSTNGQRVRLRCANEPCQPRAESGDLMPVFSVEGKSSLIAVRCRLRAKFPDRFTRALSSVSVCVCVSSQRTRCQIRDLPEPDSPETTRNTTTLHHLAICSGTEGTLSQVSPSSWRDAGNHERRNQ